MRAFAVAALASLTILTAGCGGSGSLRADPAASANLGAGAARLVPADATAFVALDTDQSSPQWQRLDQLTRDLPARADLVQKLDAALAHHGLSYDRDVKPALGSELDYAVLATHATQQPDIVAFVQPADDAKLRALASKLDTGSEHYTVQQIGGWSVVSDSDTAFAAVRAASSGRSLAGTAQYATARSQLGGDAFAWSFTRGGTAAATAWSAAKVVLGGDTLRVAGAGSPNALPPSATPVLLRDVPAGAAFAASFQSSRALTAALRTAKLPNVPLAQLAPLLDGGGVAYVRPKGIFPELAVELTPAHPQVALRQARTLLRTAVGKLVPLQLSVRLVGSKLVISDSASAAAAFRGGAKLVDETAFKDAMRAAGAPARTSSLVYANVSQLAPFLQLAAAGSGNPVDPALGDTLGKVGPLVAWSTRSGIGSHFGLWAQKR